MRKNDITQTELRQLLGGEKIFFQKKSKLMPETPPTKEATVDVTKKLNETKKTIYWRCLIVIEIRAEIK